MSAPVFGILFSAASFFLFTCFDTVSKYLSRDYSVFQIMSVEFATASLLLAGFAVLNNPSQTTREIFRIHRPLLHGMRGGLQILGQACLFLAIPHLSLSEFYIIIFCMPILGVLKVRWFLKEQSGRFIWPVLAANFCGVLIALRPDHGANLWALAAFAGTVLLAGSIVVLRKMMATETSEMASLTNTLILAAGFLLVLPFVYKPVTFSDFALMMLGGAFFAPAQIFITTAFRLAPAALASPPQFLQLVYGAVAGYVVFGDVPSLWIYIGGAIVILANGFLFWVRRGEEPGPNCPKMATGLRLKTLR